VAGLATGPLTLLGRLAVWPDHVDLWPLVLAAATVMLGVGLRRLDGVSLEALQRRSSLVGQLRFAVTVRDLRTVMLLRRQLSQERGRCC
jgi:hypothetical protein